MQVNEDLMTYKYEDGIMNNSALAEKRLSIPPYPLETIMRLPICGLRANRICF